MFRVIGGIAAAAVVATLIAIVMIARQATPMLPVSDEALIELATLRALDGRLLLGAYSRFHWHHPGPMLFYLMAPFYALSGHKTVGMNAGALAINLLAILTIAWMLIRRGGPALTIAFVAVAPFYLLRLGDMLASSWNAHAAVIPGMALIVVAAAVSAGDDPLLLLFVILASFVVQTHLAVAPLVAVVTAMVCAASAARWRRGSRWLIASAGLALVLWLPPIVEQVSRPDGNIGQLLRFFLNPESSSQTMSTAFAVWADMMSAWFRSDLRLPAGLALSGSGSAASRLMVILIVALLPWIAWRARAEERRFHMWLAAGCAAASLLALVAIGRIPESVLDHEVFWMSTIGVLSAVAVAAEIFEIGIRRIAPRVLDAWWIGPAVAAVLLIAVTRQELGELRALAQHVPGSADETVRLGTAETRAALMRTGSRKPLIRIDQPMWDAAAGVVLQLHKSGMPLGLDEQWAWMFDDTLAATGDEDAELTICGGPVHETNLTRPGNIVVVANNLIAIDLLKKSESR